MKSLKRFSAMLFFGLFLFSMAQAQDTTMTITGNKVGIGTIKPRYPLHIAGSVGEIRHHTSVDIFRGTVLLSSYDGLGNSPQLRFFGRPGAGRIDVGQDSSGAFVVEANDRIRMTVKNNGDVGVGTRTPQRKFVVSRDGQNPEINTLDPNLAAVFTSSFFTGIGIMGSKDAGSFIHLGSHEQGNSGGISVDHTAGALSLATLGFRRMTIDNAGNVGIGTEFLTPSHPLEMISGAHVTAGGVWTNASSRMLKENIAALDGAEAISALNALEPVRYNYKNQKDENYLGFIAEDVPEIVAQKDRKSLSPMDVVALLTKVVQEQQKQINALQSRLDGER